MKKLFFLLLFVTGFSFPQEKYLIYFKDKTITHEAHLSKSSNEYQKAMDLLSKRALSRRMRVLSGDSLISYEDLPIKDSYKERLTQNGIIIQKELKWFNAVSAYLTEQQLDLVRALDFVQSVEKVRVMKLIKRPGIEDKISDALLSKTLSDTTDYGYSFTQLNMSGIPLVHSRNIHGEGVVIGLLDSGFDWKEQDALKNINVLNEYDFVQKDKVTANQSGDESDQDSHGTFVFSIIAGYDPGKYMGVAYKSSYLLAKTENVASETHVEEDNYAAALEWMENQGVDITSSSLGYNEFDYPDDSYTYKDMNGQTAIVTKAAELAFKRGVLVINSAGNEGNNSWHYIIAPADGFNVIAVGAVSSNNSVAQFSSKGPTYDGRIKPDVCAMGVGVYGAQAHSKIAYGSGNGTSYSTPIVGGTAALLLSAYPYLTNTQMRSILLESSGSSSSPDINRGYGLVSAPRAIEFPNLQEASQNQYVMHKAFLNPSAIKQNSLKLFYSTDGSDNYTSISMRQDSKDGFYLTEIPALAKGNLVKFYFEYEDKNGNTIQEGKDNNYSFMYGYLPVKRNVSDSQINNYPQDFVLSQNYPNPFNTITRIDYKANANERAELFIINTIGQRVKYLSRSSSEGINSILWDGRADDGTFCASGVYCYILRLSGKDYGKKMILLK
ncbi:MAG: S8 family serine peptidase [Bacteroidota bacterium]|nr:S8 family serine peptidase [Bacteroidota bacterium]